MDADYDALERKQLQLLKQLVEIEVEQQRQRGLFKKVPHFSEIENAGRAFGRRLSCLSQARLANEVAAGEPVSRECPTCGQTYRVEVGKRTVTGLDGPVETMEPKARCVACRRDCFPSA
jgi:hypothetical protein